MWCLHGKAPHCKLSLVCGKCLIFLSNKKKNPVKLRYYSKYWPNLNQWRAVTMVCRLSEQMNKIIFIILRVRPLAQLLNFRIQGNLYLLHMSPNWACGVTICNSGELPSALHNTCRAKYRWLSFCYAARRTGTFILLTAEDSVENGFSVNQASCP